MSLEDWEKGWLRKYFPGFSIISPEIKGYLESLLIRKRDETSRHAVFVNCEKKADCVPGSAWLDIFAN